ncbi:carrier protein [Medicago truncatula]|uniref:Carrier protein n=1 Tax=Medicago truncatula TaxID=3880 RepID=G7LIQ7_MEDTR|nr:carrier protein [Medicago truncatula]
MNKGVAAAADKGLPFWHDKALNAVKVVALYFSYRPTVEFFKDTIGLELTDTALCAIFVSIIYAAACSLPVEYVMIQIQNMQPDAEGKYPYTGFLDCAVKTYKAGGILKFYTGFPLYCVRISIGVMHPSPVLDPIVPSTNPKDSQLSLRFLCGVIQGIEIWNLGFGISGKLNLEAKRNGVLIGVGDEEEKTEGEE